MALTKVSRGLISTSIVDNGNATAITIDSSENVSFTGAATFSGNVGIGTSSPAAKLDLGTSTGQKLLMYANSNIKYGMSIETSEYRMFAEDQANLTFGHMARTDGTTYTERMRIDSSGNVGIGDTTFAAGKLQVYDSAGNHVWLKGRASDGTSSVSFRNNADNAYNGRIQVADTGGMLFQVAGSTRATIDASGNLLVGTTSSSSSTAGIKLYPQGTAAFVRSGVQPLLLNRLTSDGDIALFQKDGTTVGSIGVAASNYLAIGNNNTSIQFYASGIAPATGSPSALTDNSKNLGSAGFRFKDLYLSGGVVFGDAGGTGTSSSNTLDDYEEGAWTPVDGSGAALTFYLHHAYYVKVGSTVFVSFYISYPATTSGSNAIIGGLPFTSNEYSYLSGRSIQNGVSSLQVNQSLSVLYPYSQGDARLTNTQLSGSHMLFSGTYLTTQ